MKYNGKCLAYDHEPAIVDFLSHCALEKVTEPINIKLIKLFRKAGIRRLTKRAHMVAVESLHEYLRKIIRRALIVISSHNQKSLKLIDILYALK